MLGEHVVALVGRTELLAGIDQQAFIDIDSLLRPVYDHAKQGASYGHTKIAGKQVLRKGLSPLATTISTPTSASVIAGMRLRAGKTGSGRWVSRGRTSWMRREAWFCCAQSHDQDLEGVVQTYDLGWGHAGDPGHLERYRGPPGRVTRDRQRLR